MSDIRRFFVGGSRVVAPGNASAAPPSVPLPSPAEKALDALPPEVRDDTFRLPSVLVALESAILKETGQYAAAAESLGTSRNKLNRYVSGQSRSPRALAWRANVLLI